MLSYKQTKTFLIHSLPMHPFSTPWKHQKTLHRELGKNALPWLKRAFWSVDLPKTLGRVFAFIIWPDVFLTGRVFDLKISGRVFSIKISWPSVLKHPAGCLNFKHLATHFTNAFEFGHEIILRHIPWSLYFHVSITHEIFGFLRDI